ncbi:unnamed protein product [Pieris brassicae]|uniref:Uncharacterized protein n=1 Tax=Pieris brassicae TaxID=7116 RepID=A0A9P0T6Y4_PIEBR|nr:unnamed protein product [Pieris brassicae]
MNQSNNPTPGAFPYQRQFGPSRHSLYPCFGAPAATPPQNSNICFNTVASLRKSHPHLIQRRYDPCFK